MSPTAPSPHPSDSDDHALVPRIIPRAEHGISRKNISNGALRVLYRLHEAGYKAFLVGGAVRDLLLGGHPKDFDVATDATPEQTRALFRNCRLIGRRFRLAHVVFGREIVEVATFRGVGEVGNCDRHVVDGRIVRDNVYGDIEEDAIRRDFTINALYYDIADFSVRDYVGGIEDLRQRRMHLIGDPEQRYREDPVRMLRAARLAAKLDFNLSAETEAPIRDLAPLLADVAPARLFDESLKLFLAGHGLESLRRLHNLGLLGQIFPATAEALAGPNCASFGRLLGYTFTGTDDRVRSGKTVTPAFLFAAMLWEPVHSLAERLCNEGADPAVASVTAVDRILRQQAARVAIPKRFTYAMDEIWSLQPRFEQRQKKRVMRLLAHPRFRAAYDFLLIRAHEEPELKEQVDWWTEAQELDSEALSKRLAAANAPNAPRVEGDPVRKRKRSRRKKHNVESPDTASAEPSSE
ncbi:MAG TPA: polynucleotide adenylyltransferase PcnB [Dokdonella sp.]|uniref:polynucleotide adenylyltransferase PcnB n=1 Tax=Dokdonella sp. TaxID=2291710 RepID=UPI002D7F12C9|nr:polynucleotide adenylyltransferase PcnB [Dokdonella sp.]HET9033435.1 polynucleotide adenylyltransferase PcnB [Dokdonella sp.]